MSGCDTEENGQSVFFHGGWYNRIVRATLLALTVLAAVLPKEGESVNSLATIPAIDAAAPAKIETATFAVG